MTETTLDQRWLTSTVLDLARIIYSERCLDRLPILADALMDAGCDSEELISECRAGARLPTLLQSEVVRRKCEEENEKLRAEQEANLRVSTRAGVIGNRWRVQHLMSRLTRKRPRGSGSKWELADRLGGLLDQRADRAWKLATKGQRTPTPKQADALTDLIVTALERTEGRCKQRCLTAQQIIQCARAAAKSGSDSTDAGGVANSYGYRFGSTTATAARQSDSSILVRISRSFNGGPATEVRAPARHWQDITLDSTVLKGGGNYAVRRPHRWDCYSGPRFRGVAIPISDPAAKSRWGLWEHGATIEAAQAELTRKLDILAQERETARLAGIKAEEEAKRQAKIDRAAKLLARIGSNTLVAYQDARDLGACEAGLRAFAERNNLPLDAKIPLTQIALTEPTWAIKLARRIVAARIAG